MAGVGAEQPDSGPGVVESLFSNALVWRTLGKCLNLSDLKACRLVSNDFNKNVMEETDFRSRATIKLKVEHMRPDQFGNTRENWKKVSLPIFEDSSENVQPAGQDWLCPLLTEVESLTLHGDLSSMEDGMPEYTEALIQAPKKLQCLVIDPRLLSKPDVSVLKSSQHVLSSLRSLEIKQEGNRSASFEDLNPWEYSYKEIARSATSLTEFKGQSVIPEDLEYMLDEVDEELIEEIQPILRLVETNQSHIQVLELDIPFWATPENPDLKYVGNWIFPPLRKIKIRASENDWKQVGKFLQAQPALEELDVTTLEQFPIGLLEVIREKGERLKKLHIKTKEFEETEDSVWTFLQGLPLEEFRLVVSHSHNLWSCSFDSALTILHSLPSSIKSVTLRGLPFEEDFGDSLTAAHFASINPMALTVLNLSRCGAVITDKTVKYVCRNLKMLRELNLSNADGRCTDYGFTGIRSGDDTPAFCISDLKGLKSLTLRSCGVITHKTLVLGIRFLELSFLDVSHNSRLNMEGFIEVLKHNPSLEVLRTSELDGFPPLEDLKKNGCSRLKHHEIAGAGDSDDEDASKCDSRSSSSGDCFHRGYGDYDGYSHDWEYSDDEWY